MKEKSIKKNYLYNTLYQIFTVITPMITTPYTARVFGAEGVGIQSYTASVAAYFVLFATLGTSSYGMREIARHRDDKKMLSRIFWEIELLSILSTAVCLMVYMVFLIFTAQYRIYYLILSITVLCVAFDISWLFRGLEEFKYTVTRSFIIKITGIILLFVFIRERDDLKLYIFLTSVVNLLGLLSMWMYLPGILVRCKINARNLGEHFKQTIIYFIPTIATSIYTVLDKTMIGTITKSSHQNGYYEQCTKITNMALSLATSLNSVMGSRMAYLYEHKRFDEIRSRLYKSMEFSFVLGIPITFGIIAVSRDFVPVFFGTGYEFVVTLLYFYSPLIVIISISNCLGWQYLTPCGKRAQSSKALIVGAVSNLALNLFMIPRMESVGAAISSVVAESIISVLYVRMSGTFMTWKYIFELIWKPLIAAFCMLLLVMYVSSRISVSVMGIVMEIAVGVFVYGLLMIVLREKLVMEYVSKIKSFIKHSPY